MRISRFLIQPIIFGMLCGGSPIVHASLITNGSFESGVYTPPSNDTMSLGVGATNMTGWTVISDSIAWIGPSNPWGLTASMGDFFLDLTDYAGGAPFGGVSQTISTVVGQTYALSFDLGSSNLWGRPSAIIASTAGTSQQFSSSVTGGNSDWDHFSMLFTANSPMTIISLAGSTGSNYIGLDNIAVTSVPVPASYLMMLTGLGLLGFAVGRKHEGMA